MRRLISRPAIAALAVMIHALLCLPFLIRTSFDPSTFVDAGDRWADPAAAPDNLRIGRNQPGYDGQFYYRMALDPSSFAPVVQGITLDDPPKRLQRILFPLLAWCASFGRSAATAGAMIAVNLAGIGAVGWLAATMRQRGWLSAPLAFAMILWPGFIVTLTHDTTEIVGITCLLGAVVAYLDRRMAMYAVLAALASLARETTILLPLGVLISVLLTRRGWRSVAISAAALLPMLIWHGALTLAFSGAQSHGWRDDLGWPLLGLAARLRDALFGLKLTAAAADNWRQRVVVAGTLLSLVAFGGWVGLHLRRAAAQPGMGGIAIGWVLTATLMAMLTEAGPWIDPISYLRAVTEYGVIGIVLLGAARAVSGWTVTLAIATGEVAAAWLLSWAQLR